MTVPAPWNDKNKCFIYTNPDISDMLNKEEKEKMISRATGVSEEEVKARSGAMSIGQILEANRKFKR